MSRIEWCVEGCWPAKEYHSVTVSAEFYDGRVLLKHGEVSEYVKGEEFYDVMKDVANSFNEIGKSSRGFKFGATCMIPENITDTAELRVYMISRL